MSHFDKFLLVPNEGPHPFPHPVNQTVSELDNDIQSILNGSLDDHSKWRLYEQTVQRYMHLKQQVTEPVRIGVHDILDSVPSQFKARASRLSVILKAQGHVDWSPQGEVSLDGQLLHGSHIGELLTATVNPKKLKPVGWDQFIKFIPSPLQTPVARKKPLTPHLPTLFKTPKLSLTSRPSPGSKARQIGSIGKRRSDRSRVLKWEKYPS